MDLHTRSESNIFKKLERLVEAAGINQIDFKKKQVAIKLHFGEPGNLAFIRKNYIAPISKHCKTVKIGTAVADAAKRIVLMRL